MNASTNHCIGLTRHRPAIYKKAGFDISTSMFVRARETSSTVNFYKLFFLLVQTDKTIQ